MAVAGTLPSEVKTKAKAGAGSMTAPAQHGWLQCWQPDSQQLLSWGTCSLPQPDSLQALDWDMSQGGSSEREGWEEATLIKFGNRNRLIAIRKRIDIFLEDFIFSDWMDFRLTSTIQV